MKPLVAIYLLSYGLNTMSKMQSLIYCLKAKILQVLTSETWSDLSTPTEAKKSPSLENTNCLIPYLCYVFIISWHIPLRFQICIVGENEL